MASRRRRLCRAITTIALPVAGFGAALAALPVTSAHAQAIGANLKVLSPRAGEALGSTSFSLDVSFHSISANAPVTTAELWVDGVRWARRDLQTPQVKNVLSFAIDASSLSEGQHTLLVRVLCANGSIGEIVYPVTAGDNAGEVSGGPNGPDLNFRTPSNGRRVMGRVELTIDSPSKNGANPFVTIYVDKQFKTLMNMPPYTYTWDTSNVPNGFHTVEATGYLEATNESTTRRIRVLVDNPGGNTEYKKDIPDLNAPHATASAARAVGLTARSNAVSATTTTHTARTKRSHIVATASEVAASPVATFSPIFARGIATNWFASRAAVSVANVVDMAPKAVAEPSSVVSGNVALPVEVASVDSTQARSIVPTGNASARRSTARIAGTGSLPVLHSMAGPTLVLRFAAPRQVSEIRSSPAHAGTMMNQGQNTIFPLIPAVGHAHGQTAGTRVAIRQGANGTINAVFGGKLTTVAFNGQQIAFDVQPRIEGGLPIAPFRQIFEHTGGQVDWAEKTQVVHAVNADKEIVITVGKDKASVNGEMFKMDRPAFVEKGRTIVPLSFVGAALNVKINYDPNTGRLEITSK